MLRNHQARLPTLCGIMMLAAGLSTISTAEELTSNWIYMSGQGAWVEDAVPINRYPVEIPLPADTQAVWWEDLPEDKEVVHLRRAPQETLRPGTRVRVNQSYAQHRVSAGTELTVVQLLDSGIVVTDGRTGFLIAPEDYSTLSIPLTEPPGDRLIFDSAAIPGERRIAWKTSQVSGSPQFRLQPENHDTAILSQHLVIENQTDALLIAGGLSYQPDSSNGGIVMPRALSAEMTTAGASPTETTSDVRAAIQLDQTIELTPQSSTWLPMSQQKVDLQHQFSFQWNFNNVRNQSARWHLTLTAEDALPRLSGPLSVAWFDGLYGTQETRFQRRLEREAQLDLGRTEQVTLQAEQRDEEYWQLTLINQLDNPVEVSVAMQFRVPGTNQSRQANWTTELAPGSETKHVRASAQGIEID